MPASDIVITLRSEASFPRAGEPVTCGVPFPRGMLHNPTDLRMIAPDGATTPLQVRVLGRWPDQTAKWVLCDWRATAERVAVYHLRRIEEATRPPEDSHSTCTLSTTSLEPQTEDDVRNQVESIGNRMLTSERIRLLSGGRDYTAMPDFDWYFETLGPLRVSTLERGSLTHEGTNLARYALRTHYFANSPVVRVHFTVSNPDRATHPGGLWDLGDSRSIKTSRLIIPFQIAGEGPCEGQVSPETGAPFQPCSSLFLHQVSSGGENWRSSNHVSRSGQVNVPFRGYLMGLQVGDSQNVEPRGLRATPIVTLSRGEHQLSLSVPYFWQNFPMAIAAGSEIWLHLLQGHTEPTELQGGEQKEFVFYVAMGRDTTTAQALEWTRDPLIATVDPEWIASTGAIPYFSSQEGDPNRDYQSLANLAIEGDDTFEKKREIIDEYGWRHFGDIYGDHEAILHTEFGPKPRISHYNNQYDAIAGFAVHWLRSGDVRWFRQMNELASHVRDIDIYNTDADKAAYNHGLFWHTYHYVDAGTGTHRSYPKDGRIPPLNKPVPGGGPGSEQNYAHGLMLHYFLSGDEASKDAAVGLAQWVIDMDDGNRTIFRWLSSSPTGLASASRSPDYHGPGRGAGNSVAALLDGHELTGDAKFLRNAEELIRRVIHPDDDVTGMVGMVRDSQVFIDAENRWFYVMFLASLGKYLDRKVELNELDEDYAYGRACLLHYARWMAVHEYPYLDRPEILEYPTETWAAQDMWKSEVFDYASLHAVGAERDRFRERAAFFFAASVRKLSTMPTRSLCRPVVLMLSHGWRRAWFAAHPQESRPVPTVHLGNFEPRSPFVPQKVIAVKRAKVLAAASAAVAIAALLGFLIWLLT